MILRRQYFFLVPVCCKLVLGAVDGLPAEYPRLARPPVSLVSPLSYHVPSSVLRPLTLCSMLYALTALRSANSVLIT
jgi:hypothetical protein